MQGVGPGFGQGQCLQLNFHMHCFESNWKTFPRIFACMHIWNKRDMINGYVTNWSGQVTFASPKISIPFMPRRYSVNEAQDYRQVGLQFWGVHRMLV